MNIKNKSSRLLQVPKWLALQTHIAQCGLDIFLSNSCSNKKTWLATNWMRLMGNKKNERRSLFYLYHLGQFILVEFVA
jgi:hypothetical protein